MSLTTYRGKSFCLPEHLSEYAHNSGNPCSFSTTATATRAAIQIQPVPCALIAAIRSTDKLAADFRKGDANKIKDESAFSNAGIMLRELAGLKAVPL